MSNFPEKRLLLTLALLLLRIGMLGFGRALANMAFYCCGDLCWIYSSRHARGYCCHDSHGRSTFCAYALVHAATSASASLRHGTGNVTVPLFFPHWK